MYSLIATFPSPSTGTIDIGPLTIHMYGITLLVAIVAAIALVGIRWTRRGGDWDLVLRAAVWGVAAGIVGARLYHVITSHDQLPDHWWGAFAVWEGGLGIWGGILFGCIAGGIVVWRSGESVALFADCLAPALLLAQAIGRWGNWWNQELFGKATSLPWGLDIDLEHCPANYVDLSTGCTANFHPIFLYEFVYDLVGRRTAAARRTAVPHPAARPVRPLRRVLLLRPPVRGATSDRPLARVPRHERLNFWVALVLLIASVAFFVWWQFIRKHRDPARTVAAGTVPPAGPAMAVPKGRVRPQR